MSKRRNEIKKTVEVDEKPSTEVRVNSNSVDRKIEDRKREQERKDRQSRGSKGQKLFNDFAWYNKHPALIEAAARVPFNYIKGTNLQLGDATVNLATPFISGVLEYRYRTTPGVCLVETSPFQIQVRQLYLAERSKYRGLNTYETADLAMALLAIGDFFRFVAGLERIYGVQRYYSLLNRNVPTRVLEALHVKSASSDEELANFRYGVNLLIDRAATLCLPRGISALDRWIFLQANVFKDSDNDRGDVFLFNAENCLHWSGTAVSTGSSVGSINLKQFFAGSNDNYTVAMSDWLRLGNLLLDSMLTDSDLTLIAGDIVSYYSEGKSVSVQQLLPMPEDYIVVPGYAEQFLEQVHNADLTSLEYGQPTASVGTVTTPNLGFTNASGTICSTANSGAWEVAAFQQNGVVVSQLFVTPNGSPSNIAVMPNYVGNLQAHAHKSATGISATTWSNFCGPKLLDSWKDVPSVEDVTEMTRFSISLSKYHGTDTSFGSYTLMAVEACGSEVITGLFMYTNNGSLAATRITTVGSASVSTLAKLGKFDWHPILYEGYLQSGTTNFAVQHVCGDLDNCRARDTNLLSAIHDCALMSEWTISSNPMFNKG